MSKTLLEQFCPCGSNLDYQACCHRFHTFEHYPDTAAQLMRSRYTAFACLGQQDKGQQSNGQSTENPNWLDYLRQTHWPPTEGLQESTQLEQFAKQNNWLELKIINRQKGQVQDQTGVVEFIALYQPKQAQHMLVLHEKSRFERIEGKWQYLDGDIYPTSLTQARGMSCKIQRNEPCWCDSGKKRKKCHPN